MADDASRTIKAQWKDYLDKVIPRQAGYVQIKESRRAFYAGALAMFNLTLNVAPDDVSEDEGVDILSELVEELKQFGTDVTNGKA